MIKKLLHMLWLDIGIIKHFITVAVDLFLEMNFLKNKKNFFKHGSYYAKKR